MLVIIIIAVVIVMYSLGAPAWALVLGSVLTGALLLVWERRVDEKMKAVEAEFDAIMNRPRTPVCKTKATDLAKLRRTSELSGR